MATQWDDSQQGVTEIELKSRYNNFTLSLTIFQV